MENILCVSGTLIASNGHTQLFQRCVCIERYHALCVVANHHLCAEAGWKVLQKGFTGFKETKMKMKDFDRQESSESDDGADNPPEAAVDDGEDWWTC